jgi:hypothetical protein
MAPSRHGTFEKFVQLVQQDGTFTYKTMEDFSKRVSLTRKDIEAGEGYDRNLHCPKLLIMTLKG